MAFIKPSGRSDITRRAMDAAEVNTSPPAYALVKQCGLVDKQMSSVTILDLACGSGILTKQLHQHCDSQRMEIVCGDLDHTMVELVHESIRTEDWHNVRCELVDAHQTPFPDASFDFVLMNFGPQLMEDPYLVLRETYRILKPGGTCGFTTWLRPGFIASVKNLFPGWNPGTTPVGHEWRDAEKIKAILTDMQFNNVESTSIEFDTEGADIEGYLETLTTVLMAPFFAQGDNRAKYSAYMRQPGQMKMTWLALIVTARK